MDCESLYKEYLAVGSQRITKPEKMIQIPMPGPNINIPQEIKVTVEVSGSIQFLFGFQK
jgi:hypothetical protein